MALVYWQLWANRKNFNRFLQRYTKKAPLYFLIDIQKSKEDLILLKNEKLISDIKTAPMLRGFITKINDKDVSELNIDHWAQRIGE